LFLILPNKKTPDPVSDDEGGREPHDGVILSEAKDLAHDWSSFFAALRMTRVSSPAARASGLLCRFLAPVTIERGVDIRRREPQPRIFAGRQK
jgi:hypothetical protein